MKIKDRKIIGAPATNYGPIKMKFREKYKEKKLHNWLNT